MGVLTNDLTRLRNEVLALRSARRGLIHDLERETKNRQADVFRMLADFSKGLGAVARKTRADRLRSISDLKRTVNGLQRGVRMDLGGIRQAWIALGIPSPRAVEELSSLPPLEVEADAEERQSETGRRAVEDLTSSPTLEAEANAEERPSETGGKRPFEPFGGEKPARKKKTH